MPYPFLSDEWFSAAKAIREEAGDIGPPGGNDIKLNVTVVEGPMGDTEVHLADGVFDRGHVEDAPTKATVPYDVARQLFVDGNPQAAMQAFMSGQLRIEGDISKIMAVQGAAMSPSAEQRQMQEKLREITA
ncbi:MAG: SCP2 sterol-binding domain-containing protein [Acidimicrobiia bacterium]|nr:SCP2 sterol-binding domain-containing protein [Acidimicrobiia bacterium]